jgi:predicted NBD/HSP70 family sugar kinase
MSGLPTGATPQIRLGVDLGGTKTEIIALDSNGAEVWRKRVPTPRGDYYATVQTIAGLVRDAEQALAARASVGIGTPGAISAATGRMKNCNSTWLNGMPLKQDVEAAVGRAVRIANDANCFALAEAIDGAARGAHTVFGVILGTGVGGGIVIDGKFLEGANSIAGEWGHNPLPWPEDDDRPGPACYCGRSGCIETFLSGPGFAREYGRLAGRTLEAPQIVSLAEAGDPVARACLNRFYDRLARSLAHVINILDPEVIVIGGGMSNIAHLYREVPGRWGNHVFSDAVATRLVPHGRGDSSGVRGAAWLW